MDEISKVIQRKSHIHKEIDDLRRRISNIKSVKPVDIVVARALATKVVDLQSELNVIEVLLTS